MSDPIIKRQDRSSTHMTLSEYISRNGNGFEKVLIENVDVSSQMLTSINLKDASIRGSNFSEVYFYSSGERRTNLEGVYFFNCNLQNVKFGKSSKLTVAEFVDCNLEGAIFQIDCNLKNAKFKNCNLKGAIFVNSNLSGVDMETSSVINLKLDGVFTNDQTKFPTGF